MTAPALGRLPRRTSFDGPAVALGALAAAVVVAGLLLGWRGVDLPAQLYRVGLFRREGFTLWDSQWFGGHWLLDYSVVFPAVASSIGVGLVTILSAAAATVAFDRLVVWHFGTSARVASIVFALGVAVQSSIGQLTFLLGEAAGLWCLVALARRRWAPAVAGALVATLASPLAGAFVALAVVASWVGSAPAFAPGRSGTPRLPGALVPAGGLRAARGPITVLLAAALPVVATSLLFPGQGPMPYPFTDYLWELVVVAGLFVLTPRGEHTLRVGMVLYALAATASEVVATPLGGNIGRLEDLTALPLVIAVLWPRVGSGSRAGGWILGWPMGSSLARRCLVVSVVAVPLAVSQWAPAWAAMTSNPARPWTHGAYYRPLVSWLEQRGGPAGRTEVVPTADHWEAAYVAPSVPLARGWERQLDVADNPIFYTAGALTASSYRAWLLDNGVRYVALPSAPLDLAGAAEGALVARGVPGLRMAWHHGGWTVYLVEGSTGIVGPGARLVHLDGGNLSVAIRRPGPVVIRVRWSSAWQVSAGHAVLSEAPGRWLSLDATSPGIVDLRMRLL